MNTCNLTIEEAVEQMVPGADPSFWEDAVKNYNPNKATRKKSKSRRRSPRHIYSSTRRWRADSVLSHPSFFEQQRTQGQAMAGLVNRANGNDDGRQEKPQCLNPQLGEWGQKPTNILGPPATNEEEETG
jgi:hypothetical protein